jgi:hypothetical protein
VTLSQAIFNNFLADADVYPRWPAASAGTPGSLQVARPPITSIETSLPLSQSVASEHGWQDW